MRQPPPMGSSVKLTDDAYGYPAGSHGTVVRRSRQGADAVVVRFDETGHTLLVELAHLALAG